MIQTDVVIAGAGPTGLFQVFELGLLGVRAHVVDSVPNVGGQCVELYPDKPIYDIPAIPVCSAKELVQRLETQIRPFDPHFHLGDTVKQVTPLSDGKFLVTTRNGTAFQARALIVAGGLGAFVWRKLAVPDAERLEGKSVHYKVVDSHQFDGKELVIAGGGDAAIDWALALAARARSLVLIHHSAKFRAVAARVHEMERLCAAGQLQFAEGEIVGLETDGDVLKSVRTRMRSGVVQRIGADALLVFWGMHPSLGPIARWGLELDQQQVVVDPATFQTSVPDIYAVGDIASYPGKKKLILSGFHEAALCAFAVKEYLNPGTRVHLQYTTTSPLMHRRLGVAVDAHGDPIDALDAATTPAPPRTTAAGATPVAQLLHALTDPPTTEENHERA